MSKPEFLPLIYSPYYSMTAFPNGHRFPMSKFGLLRQALLDKNIARFGQFLVPDPVGREALELVHDGDYVGAFLEGRLSDSLLRRLGLPWSIELVRRVTTASGGTLLAARTALEVGLACNLAGGTHHAFKDHGAGYCVFNDLVITCSRLLQEGVVDRILIVDLDVHQGDGTAKLLENDPRVFTFSMHGRTNFPRKKQCSDRDIGLDKGCGDETYLNVLSEELPGLIERVQPDLVLYDAGVDPHHSDLLGHLNLTTLGLSRRDELVLLSCVERGIPVATVVGGGYNKDRQHVAELHCTLFEAATKIYQGLS